MGLMHRLTNLLNANLNDLLDQAEDPERMLRQAVRELETGVARSLDAAARAIAHERLLARHQAGVQQRLAASLERARTAVRRNADAEALGQLRLKAQHEHEAASLGEQHQQAGATSARLREQVIALRQKLTEARGRLEDLTARGRAAHARRLFVARLPGDAVDAQVAGSIERFAQRIERDEAEVEALSELVGQLAAEPLDEAALEAELRAMKEECDVAG
jgi:phage shock protein A